MAENAVFPLNLKLHLHRNYVGEQLFVPRKSEIRMQRKFYHRSSKSIECSSRNARKLTSHWTNVNCHRLEESFIRYCCLGALVNVGNTTSSDWVPMVDQVLLMTSIFLTYIAGVIPATNQLTNAHKDDSTDSAVPKNSSPSGSSAKEMENDKEINFQFAWAEVEVKLLNSLDAMKQGVNTGVRITGFQKEFGLRPSSLLAIAEYSRLRLVWISFRWLKKEVDNISENSKSRSNEELLKDFTLIIENSCQPLCLAWLEEELYLKSSNPDKALLSSLINKLSGYDNILQYIRKSGKEDLYAEFICALVCGSARMSSYYDHSLFTQYGVAILEDLVITLADGISSMYLELISVDSSMSNEVNSLGLSMCTLSTRALQRLRNEVALHQWLHQNMESVVSMYEDRFELRTLQSHVIEESSKCESENFKWWQKFSLRKSGSVSPALSFVVVSPISISVKRTKELRALTGWRYYCSLFLELADIAMPLIRTVITKISDAISFFLVCLIGRSLGLIYTGIRQSLRWK